MQYAYWSSFSGLEDKVENYANITYELIENEKITLLGITQDNIATAEMFNWISRSLETALKGLKEVVEEK